MSKFRLTKNQVLGITNADTIYTQNLYVDDIFNNNNSSILFADVDINNSIIPSDGTTTISSFTLAPPTSVTIDDDLIIGGDSTANDIVTNNVTATTLDTDILIVENILSVNTIVSKTLALPVTINDNFVIVGDTETNDITTVANTNTDTLDTNILSVANNLNTDTIVSKTLALPVTINDNTIVNGETSANDISTANDINVPSLTSNTLSVGNNLNVSTIVSRTVPLPVTINDNFSVNSASALQVNNIDVLIGTAVTISSADVGTLTITSGIIASNGAPSITNQDDVQINGDLSVTGSVFFTATPSGLNFYEEFVHTSSWSAGDTDFPTVSLIITRIGSLVTIFIPSMTATTTSLSSAVINLDTNLPVRFRPPRETLSGYVESNMLGIISVGEMRVQSSGNITLYRDIGWDRFPISAAMIEITQAQMTYLIH